MRFTFLSTAAFAATAIAAAVGARQEDGKYISYTISDPDGFIDVDAVAKKAFDIIKEDTGLEYWVCRPDLSSTVCYPPPLSDAAIKELKDIEDLTVVESK